MEELTAQLRAFVRDRDWEQFHTPRNLATAIIIEAAELLEHFQWEVDDSKTKPDGAGLEEELADVAIYCLLLAARCDIDLEKAIHKKIASNAQKYPLVSALDETMTPS